MKNLASIAIVSLCLSLLSGCNEDDAKVASYNLSKAANNFEIMRRIVFYNGITGEYMLSLEGLCAIENNGQRVAVTCKTGPDKMKKHFLGLSDNVTYFAEQLGGVAVNVYHHRVTFKPQSILPDVDFRGGSSALINAVTPDSKD